MRIEECKGCRYINVDMWRYPCAVCSQLNSFRTDKYLEPEDKEVKP